MGFGARFNLQVNKKKFYYEVVMKILVMAFISMFLVSCIDEESIVNLNKEAAKLDQKVKLLEFENSCIDKISDESSSERRRIAIYAKAMTAFLAIKIQNGFITQSEAEVIFANYVAQTAEMLINDCVYKKAWSPKVP